MSNLNIHEGLTLRRMCHWKESTSERTDRRINLTPWNILCDNDPTFWPVITRISIKQARLAKYMQFHCKVCFNMPR